jgi:hypothetical protein
VYWEILGIEPTTNKKNIKLAYAKKLKAVRPEDDPQAFQELRKAYQWALKYCEHEEPYDEYNPDVELAEPAHEYNLIFDETQKTDYVDKTLQEFHLTFDETANTQPKLITETLEVPPASDETDDYYSESEEETISESQLEQDWDTLFDRVTVILNTQGNKISHWKFIEELPSMQDMNFKNDVSYKLFSMLSETNQISLLQHKALRIKPKVLNYLNSIFAWDTQWQHFQKEFGDKQTDAIIQYLGSEFKPQKSYFWLRVGAFISDMMISLTIGTVATLFSLFCFHIELEIGRKISLIFSFICFFIVIPIMEATPLQASIGKKVVGLMVINQYGERIAWYQSLFRNWLTIVNIALLQVTLWINLFLIYKYNTLLQDSLSRSYVTRSR